MSHERELKILRRMAAEGDLTEGGKRRLKDLEALAKIEKDRRAAEPEVEPYRVREAG